MKRLERFLVAFAVLAVIVRLCSLKEGIVLVTFALPALAAFYMCGSYFLLRENKAGGSRKSPAVIILAIIAGAGFAYCLLSLLSFFLRWIPLADFLENTLIITGLLSLIPGIAFSRTRNAVYKDLLLRSLSMLIAFVLIGITISYFFSRAK